MEQYGFEYPLVAETANKFPAFHETKRSLLESKYFATARVFVAHRDVYLRACPWTSNLDEHPLPLSASIT